MDQQNRIYKEESKEIPIRWETDVLVVGGGSAGVIAAIAAARGGCRVILTEKDISLGGLWTNGLVLRLYGTHILKNRKQINYFGGIGREFIQCLDKIPQAVQMFGEDGFEPVADPEAAIYQMEKMLTQENVRILYQCMAVEAMMDGTKINGVIYESKCGRFAIQAKIVIDTTGDGDVYARAGADFEKICAGTGLNFFVGNADRVAVSSAQNIIDHWADTPNKSVIWVNTHTSSCNLDDLERMSAIIVDQRKKNWETVQNLKQQPGCAEAFLLKTASQFGYRMTRALKGVYTLTREDIENHVHFNDCIGISGWANYLLEYQKEESEWQIPYRILVPNQIDGLLTAGRCVSADKAVLEHLRLIPNCMITGHAAGTAASLCVQNGWMPRAVDIPCLQKCLAQQKGIL